MAVYTWTDGLSEFVYTYDESEVAIKDQVRGMIGDVNGLPVSYMSDIAIEAVAASCGNDPNLTAAVCCERCASRTLQVAAEINQGHRLRIKNFDPAKAYEAFLKLSLMYRNKSTPLSLPLVGAAVVEIEGGRDRRRDWRRR